MHRIKRKQKYRSYDAEQMKEALRLWEEGTTVYKAAKLTGVPEQTLRDRTCGHVHHDTNSSGPARLFTDEEEADLVKHIKETAVCGYGYDRPNLLQVATDTAVFLKKRQQKNISDRWLDHFLKRWPELKVSRPRQLSMVRAKTASPDKIEAYYDELETIMDKYNFGETPHLIFNVDETGISPEHTLPSIVGPRGKTLPAVVSPRTATTTVISCVSATGQVMPPYFIFKGKRMTDDLLEGALPGTAGRMSDSGWSNTALFQDFLLTHFTEHCPDKEKPALLLYDGNRSHLAGPLITWGRENNVVLFVLPPHCSHILQPLDVGCFGPLKKIYNNVCQKFMQDHPGHIISRYDICRLVCQAYSKAFTPATVVSSFRKTGIYPFDRHVIPEEATAPSSVTTPSKNVITTEIPSSISTVSPPTNSDNNKNTNNTTTNNNNKSNSPKDVKVFLKEKVPKWQPPFKKAKTQQRSHPGGIAITESGVAEEMGLFQTPKKTSSKQAKKPRKLVSEFQSSSPVAGPSGLQNPLADNNSDSENDTNESDLCCVCRKPSPPGMRDILSVSVVILNWAKCDTCGHWTHLKFCCPQESVSNDPNVKFLCPHCDPNQA